ncbi:hypothetical protein [Nonomuraea candida]|uniref:hypothetical protein n=1 Tax=Nonomuraea candida TaxID=359159 RepID=UPI0005B7650A|nr:hypothetical protein [Nonomuraea candida]
MAVLKYEDLLADVEREKIEKGLEFHAKDGEVVILRPVLLLSKDELKVVQVQLKVIGDDKVDTFGRIDAMDAIMIAAADKKKSLKDSLGDLPPQLRARVFETWMQAADTGEASA